MEKKLSEYEFKPEKYKVSLDVIIVKDENQYTILGTNETNNFFGMGIFGSGATPEEAEKRFWQCAKAACSFYKSRADQLDKYKWFSKGDWGASRWKLVYNIWHQYLFPSRQRNERRVVRAIYKTEYFN